MAGNADYQRWLQQQRQQAYQFAVGAAQNAAQMNQSRMLALSGMANQNQQQAQQQNFELQKLPLQAQIESQQQAFQSGLQGQNQQNLAMLQGGLQDQASQRDFLEAKQLSAQNALQLQQGQAAQQQMHTEGQQQVLQYQDQLKQGQIDAAMFQNPLQQHMKNVQQAQQAGYSFTPDQQKQVDGLKSDIGAIQQSVSGGDNSMGTVLPAMKQKVAQLNAMIPNQPPPTTTQQKIDQSVVMGVRGPDGQIIQGTEQTPFTIDAKTGTAMVVRGWKQPDFGPEGPAEEDHSLAAEKVRAQTLKNQGLEANVHMKGYEWASKMVNEEMKANPFAAMDPMTGQPNPGYRDQRMAYYMQQYQQATANVPSGQTAVAPGQQPGGNAPPQAAQNPALPQQIPPPPEPNPQTAGQQPPQRQASQQSPQPDLVAEHDKMLAQVPPKYQEEIKRLHAEGNHQGALAVPMMYHLVQQYGADPKRWPAHVADMYESLAALTVKKPAA